MVPSPGFTTTNIYIYIYIYICAFISLYLSFLFVILASFLFLVISGYLWKQFILSVQCLPVNCFPHVRHFRMRELRERRAFCIPQDRQGILSPVLRGILEHMSIFQIFPYPFVVLTQTPTPFLSISLSPFLSCITISLFAFFLDSLQILPYVTKQISCFCDLILHVCHPWLFPLFHRLCIFLIFVLLMFSPLYSLWWVLISTCSF